MKTLIKKLDDITFLYRDTKTGIAWVENGHNGSIHSAHPNIDATGAVIGMKKLGYWRYDCLIKRSHGTIYNISICSVQDSYDELARQYCECGGCHD